MEPKQAETFWQGTWKEFEVPKSAAKAEAAIWEEKVFSQTPRVNEYKSTQH